MAELTDADQLARLCAEFMWSNDNASQHLGIVINSMYGGKAVVSMTVRDNMVNGHDTCHGGMIFSLADSAFAFACNSQNHAAVAANCSIDFIQPAYRGDHLTANAVMVHQGRRTGIYDIAVSNQDGRVIARMRGRSSRLKGPVIPGDCH